MKDAAPWSKQGSIEKAFGAVTDRGLVYTRAREVRENIMAGAVEFVLILVRDNRKTKGTNNNIFGSITVCGGTNKASGKYSYQCPLFY
jgi:hypothetical protein